MIVLGIGITHDSGAAIIENGIISCAINEERLNRIKTYIGFPEHSIRNVMNYCGLHPKDIDCIGVNPLLFTEAVSTYGHSNTTKKSAEVLSKFGITKLLTGNKIIAPWFIKALIRSKNKNTKTIIEKLRAMGFECPIQWVEHHMAHAASAYYTSGWPDCLTLTLDGSGDGYCSKVFDCSNGKMQEFNSVLAYHSISRYYAYTTTVLGFINSRHEGKVTGLSAYGDPNKTINIFKERVDYYPDEFTFKVSGKYRNEEIDYLKKRLRGYSREDVAAGVQALFEEAITAYTAKALDISGQKNIALAGGVFANVKLNQRIRELPGVQEIYVFPHMGDGGGGVGSGYTVAAQLAKKNGTPPLLPKRLNDVYLGPDYTEEDIKNAITASRLPFAKKANIHKAIAERLNQGKIVARFNGRMEFGPRALGNRSILYKADDPTVNDWLNRQLNRTEFMPFAPAILETFAEDYLESYTPGMHHTSFFMTDTFNIKREMLPKIPAAVHIDGTARPQIVSKKISPDFHEILNEYKSLSGIPVLINTSFNMHEEPIVCTPDEALNAFKQAGIDFLAIGDYLVWQ